MSGSHTWDWDDRPEPDGWKNCGTVGCEDYETEEDEVVCKGTTRCTDEGCRCMLFWSDIDDKHKPWQPVPGNRRRKFRTEIYGCFCVKPKV